MRGGPFAGPNVRCQGGCRCRIGAGRGSRARILGRRAPPQPLMERPMLLPIGDRGLPRIAILGAGYVGVTTAVAFAEKGHLVVLVGTDPQKVACLEKGQVPFYEPGVSAAFAKVRRRGAIEVADDVTVASPSFGVAVLCVGTPSREDGSIDLEESRSGCVGPGQECVGTPAPVAPSVHDGSRSAGDFTLRRTSGCPAVAAPSAGTRGPAMRLFGPSRSVLPSRRFAEGHPDVH